MPIHYKSGVSPRNVSPMEALKYLKEGNFRFINNMPLHHDLASQLQLTKHSQSPFAIILSCMDSRTSAELIFDLGFGDIFSVRIAGNVITTDILGCMEYATEAIGSPLILILGHTSCGAIKGACDQVDLGHLTPLLSKIQPAIMMEDTIKEEEKRNGGDSDYLRAVSRLNAIFGVNEIVERSEIIRNLVEKGKVGIVPALYDVATGKVEFYEEHGIIRSESHAKQHAAGVLG